MKRHTVVTMPGDGIGAIVLPEAVRVLEATGFEAEWVHADIGWRCWCEEGNALPDRTVELLREHRLGLFGAITSKPRREAEEELAPRLRDQGFSYYSPILGLRQIFNLDVCIRPCRTFPGNPLNFVRRGPVGIEEPLIDAVIFRQNTEGIYAGLEWTDPPDEVLRGLATHPKFRRFADVPGEDMAISTRLFTRGAVRRIVRAGFEHAQRHGYDSVTVCEKANVLRETSGMMVDEAQRIAADYPTVQLRNVNVDALMMWATRRPEEYGVIVAGNLFGDIVSDAFAGLVGGMGFACSANVGDEVAVFEPSHGSAPKYAHLDPPPVNPTAMILSGAMMLEHIGEAGKAERIRAAIAAVIREGRIRTADLLHRSGGPEAFRAGAASTTEFTDAVLEELVRLEMDEGSV
jgi:3-isopropylmalate dehydrogenase